MMHKAYVSTMIVPSSARSAEAGSAEAGSAAAGRITGSRVSTGVRLRCVARNNDDSKFMMMSTMFVLSSARSVEDGGRGACGGCVGVKSNNWKHGGGGETLGGSAEAEGVDCPLYEESFVV